MTEYPHFIFMDYLPKKVQFKYDRNGEQVHHDLFSKEITETFSGTRLEPVSASKDLSEERQLYVYEKVRLSHHISICYTLVHR